MDSQTTKPERLLSHISVVIHLNDSAIKAMVDYLRLRSLRQDSWIQRWMLCSERHRLPQQYYASLCHYADTAVNDFLHHLLHALPCGCRGKTALSPVFPCRVERGLCSSVATRFDLETTTGSISA